MTFLHQILKCLILGLTIVISLIQNGSAQQITHNHVPMKTNANKSESLICENKPPISRMVFSPDDVSSKHECSQIKGFVPKIAKDKETDMEFHSEKTESILSAVNPIMGVNFLANELQSGISPSDNSIAVSDAGYIVTVDSRTIEYYKTDGTNLLAWETLEHFFNDINLLQADFYDPKVIYDPKADRFVFIVMNGGNVANNNLVLAFSKTDNPMDGWYKDYRILANSLEPTFFMDRPSIGITGDELFISGGMANASLDHATLIQIGLQEGYNNNPLDYRFWINYSANPIIIAPASYGQDGFYGPNMYMVGTDEIGSNQVYLFEVTGLRSSPGTVINTYSIACTAYSPGSDANQLGNAQLLDVGDCRMQSAFYLNGKVHFVFSGDAGSGWNGIKYKIIDIVNLSVAGGEHQWQLTGNFDYCYPSIASFGTDPTDESAMICFLRTGPSIYPQVCVVNFDDGAWSPSGTKIVKASLGPISLFPAGTVERWGDYTGIQRMYGNPNRTCWLVGAYCFGSGTNHWLVNNGWNAWAAEILEFPVGLSESINGNLIEVYPNPTSSMIYIKSNLEYKDSYIELIDLTGKIVVSKKLGHKELNSLYELNIAEIPNGVYILHLQNSNDLNFNEKVIILH